MIGKQINRLIKAGRRLNELRGGIFGRAINCDYSQSECENYIFISGKIKESNYDITLSKADKKIKRVINGGFDISGEDLLLDLLSKVLTQVEEVVKFGERLSNLVEEDIGDRVRVLEENVELLTNKVEELEYELSSFEGIQSEIESIETRLSDLNAEMDNIFDIQQLENKIDNLGEDFQELESKFDRLEDDIAELER